MPTRPESLSANFSEVLRPHDPYRGGHSAYPHAGAPALDLRESITALLDLASESLEASSLVLAIDRVGADLGALEGLLHALMYIGGQVVKPGCLEGGWHWDQQQWVLVGMEL